ncbi:PREDICTED: thioredoxin domain-containing protein 15-like [Priapulus caudatus]|uniref:Thioredoxin domain-containing protein 15-like n=1 Tax=Priapulus caudatus TaxID=37621 RepID=A0ABM1EQA4_PRICU|nr:PREDICTED: thioredoxin domain-containing protein 15-like [Priapulus caudatus]
MNIAMRHLHLCIVYYMLLGSGFSSAELSSSDTDEQTIHQPETSSVEELPVNEPMKAQIEPPEEGFTSTYRDKLYYYQSFMVKDPGFTSSNSGDVCDADDNESCSESAADTESLPALQQSGQETVNITEAAGNSTTNQTRITCIPAEISDGYEPSVRIVNGSELLDSLKFGNDSKYGNCLLVFFYTPWCPFSAKVAPHYNALAKAFPTLQIVAIDALKFNSINTRLGTFAVPNIVLFHSGRPVLRFNQSERNLDTLKLFVYQATGLQANAYVVVTEEDYWGPLPSEPEQRTDYMLWLAWSFIIFCVVWFGFQSTTGERVITQLHRHLRTLVHRHQA